MTPEKSPPEFLGKHRLHVEGDTVFFIAKGSLTLEDMRMLLVKFARIKQQHGCLFVLYDAREATGIDKDAREYAVKQPSHAQEADLQVAFGISFAVRVLLLMIIRAQKVLQNRAVTFHPFDDVVAARTFFEAERARIRLEKKP